MTKPGFKTTDSEIRAGQIRLMYSHFTCMPPANIPATIIFGYMIPDASTPELFMHG
jgi:hypothetical protein